MIWETVKIGEVFKVTSGGTPNRKQVEYFKNGTIPWVKTGDLKGRYVNTPAEFITLKALNNSSAKIFPKNTVLLAMYGATIGACSILPFEAATNQACGALLPSDTCDSTYLYYYLRSIKGKLIKKGVGGAQPNISGTIIKGTKIPLPPLATQQKIAALLNAADAHRQKTKVLLTKYEELAQSIFLEMFGDPVMNFKGWDVCKMVELSTLIGSGSTPKGGSQVYVNKGILFLRSQNVWRNRLDLDDAAFIDAQTHKGLRKSSLKYGDILMTKTVRVNTENSSLGRAAMYLGEDDKANVNGHVYLIRPKPEVNKEFILFILTTREYRDYIRRVCVGGIDKRQLNKEHLEEFPIICPPFELQELFVQRLKSIKNQMISLKESRVNSENLFNSLLQKAFKGELVH